MRQDYKILPIYKKAEEIGMLVDAMTDFVKDYEFDITYDFEQEMVDESIESMQRCAFLLRTTIQETCWEEIQYHEVMERAVLVKYYAEEIVCDANRFENTGLKESDFVDVFHTTLEEFRLLFVEWIKTFNKWKYYEGSRSWGLFDSDDVVVINYLTGERYDEDNELHLIMNSDHMDPLEDYEDEDEFDEDDDDFDDDEV